MYTRDYSWPEETKNANFKFGKKDFGGAKGEAGGVKGEKKG
jgi:hypothetical protein